MRPAGSRAGAARADVEADGKLITAQPAIAADRYALGELRMDTMKAVVKTKPELGAELQDKPIPKPASDWVVVRVRATSPVDWIFLTMSLPRQ